MIFALGNLVASHGQNFCPLQKIFCSGQNYFVLDKSDFVHDKKHFVWADGQGIRRKEKISMWIFISHQLNQLIGWKKQFQCRFCICMQLKFISSRIFQDHK